MVVQESQWLPPKLKNAYFLSFDFARFSVGWVSSFEVYFSRNRIVKCRYEFRRHLTCILGAISSASGRCPAGRCLFWIIVVEFFRFSLCLRRWNVDWFESGGKSFLSKVWYNEKVHEISEQIGPHALITEALIHHFVFCRFINHIDCRWSIFEHDVKIYIWTWCKNSLDNNLILLLFLLFFVSSQFSSICDYRPTALFFHFVPSRIIFLCIFRFLPNLHMLFPTMF